MNTLTEVKLECVSCRKITWHAVEDERTMCTKCGRLHHSDQPKLLEVVPFSSQSPKHGGLTFRAAVSPYLYLTREGGA